MNEKKQRKIQSEKFQSSKRPMGLTLGLIVVLAFLTFFLRFFYIGIFHTMDGQNLTARAKQQYTNDTTLKARRGTIYDASGDVLAEDTTLYSVYVVLSKDARTISGKPDYLKQEDKQKAAKILSKYLETSEEKIYKVLNPENKDTYQVELAYLGKHITQQDKKKIQSYHMSGIKFTPIQSRLYPNGSMAAHTIGVTSTTNGKLTGLLGIEKVYNEMLNGKDGIKKAKTDMNGVQAPGTKLKTRPVKNGDNIYTTINARLQAYMESLISKAQDKYHPVSMSAVMMDAKTGEILALTQRPSFDPKTKEGLIQNWTDALFQKTYEPGSVMKTMTLAAAINNKTFNGNGYYNSGRLNIDGSYVYDWNRVGWGTISYNQAYIRSSNVGLALVERQMGAKTWLKYIKKFGFLKSTNTGLGDESKGSISYTYPIDRANTAYGQGINVTAFQIVQAYSAIANEGEMLRPRIINKIVDPNTGKVVYRTKKTVSGHPVTAQTAKQVLNLMGQVVTDKNGTGQAYKINGYNVGVKTGTAQIANPNGGGYMSGDMNYIFSVCGIAPLDNPRYILYITMKQPKTFGSEGEATKDLSTVFNPLMSRALKEESHTVNKKNVAVPDVLYNSVTESKQRLEQLGLQVTVLGSGSKVKSQSIEGNENVMKSTRILLYTGGVVKMPDLTGWSRSNVSQLAQLLGLDISFEGSGFVTNQSIKANAIISKGQKLTVELD